MFLKIKLIFPVIGCLLLLLSCSEYQKVLKNEDVKAKYDLAEKYYTEENYKKAQKLLDQIAPKYVGKPQGERVMFFLAHCYYEIEDYYLAGYQFERFVKSYPGSDKLQEAAFLEAKSYYKLSPRYSLDQTDTDKALAKLQTFINTYPESEFFKEANALARELTLKKEKKALEIAKQYNKLGEFNYPVLLSAVVTFDNFITDNPGSVYREEALYYRTEAATRLALNSTENKKKERLKDALASYNTLLYYFPETQFKKQADGLSEKIQNELGIQTHSQQTL